MKSNDSQRKSDSEVKRARSAFNPIRGARNAIKPVSRAWEVFQPYVSANKSPLEFTFKAAVPGIVFGIVFGAANAYLGLQAGLTISTSIPIAVMTIAAFRAFRAIGMKGTILAKRHETLI